MSEIVGLGVEIRDNTRKGAISAGRSFDKLTKDAAKTTKGVGRMERGLKSLGRTLKSDVARVAMGGLGMAAMAAQLRKGMTAAIEFNAAMAEVSTLLDDANTGMVELTAAAREMALEFGTSTAEQAKAQYQVISAGAVDAAQAIDILTVANKLAKGGVTDAVTAVDGLTSVMNAYGGAAGSATQIADRLFTTVRLGKTTITELNSSMSQVVGIAAQTGVSFDEINAATAALTKGSQQTSMAMRGIRQMISSMIAPSEGAIKVAGKLGLQFNAAALASRGLSGMLEDITLKTGGSTKLLAKLFPPVEALAAVMPLVGTGAGFFAEGMDAMTKSAGALEAANLKIDESDSWKLRKAQAKWDATWEALGNTVVLWSAATITHVEESVGEINRILGTIGADPEDAAKVYSAALEKERIRREKLASATGISATEFERDHATGPPLSARSRLPDRTAGMPQFARMGWHPRGGPVSPAQVDPSRSTGVTDEAAAYAIAQQYAESGGIGKAIAASLGLDLDAPDPIQKTDAQKAEEVLRLVAAEEELKTLTDQLTTEVEEARTQFIEAYERSAAVAKEEGNRWIDEQAEEELAREDRDFMAVFEAEEDLALRRADIISETEGLAVRHKQERLRMEALQNKKLLEGLDKVHAKEKEVLESKILAEKEADSLSKRNQILDESIGLIRRMNPQLASLAGAFRSLVEKDPIGFVFNAINAFLDFSETARQEAKALREEQERQRGLSVRTSGDFATAYAEANDPEYEEMRSQIQSVFARAFELRKEMAGTRHNPEYDAYLERLQEAADQGLPGGSNSFEMAPPQYIYDQPFDMYETVKAFIETFGQVNQDFEHEAGQWDIGTLRAAMAEMGVGMEDWHDMLQRVFGSTGTLQEAAMEMLDLESAADDAAKSVSSLTDAEKRANRLRFTGEEIKARTEASEAYARAGSDVILQKKVLDDLALTIASIRDSEAAANRSGTRYTASAAPPGAPPVPGTAPSGSSGTADAAAKSAAPYVVTSYGDLINLEGATPIDVHAYEAIKLLPSFAWQMHGISSTQGEDKGWSSLIGLDDLTKERVGADRIMTLFKMPAFTMGIDNEWSNLVILDRLHKHNVAANRIMRLFKMPAWTMGIDNEWSNLVTLDRLHKHNVSADRIMRLYKVPAWRFGIDNEWSNLVILDELHKHEVSAERIMNLNAAPAWKMGTNNATGASVWSNIVDLSGLHKHEVSADRIMDITPSDVDVNTLLNVTGRIQADVSVDVALTGDIRDEIEHLIDEAISDGRVSTAGNWNRQSGRSS